MTDTTAKIRAKGLDSTGVTEDLARKMCDNLGGYYKAIVELKVDAVHEDAEGNRKVDLILTQVEPSNDANLDEHLRELTRTLHFNRKTTEDGPTLLDGDSSEPTVEAVTAAGARHRPHPYLASGLAIDDDAVCDVCGQHEPAGVHSVQDTLPAGDDHDDHDDSDGGELDEEDEPHAFDSDDDVDSCRICGRHELDGEDIHVTDEPAPDEPARDPMNPFAIPTT